MVLFSALSVPADVRHKQDGTCAYVNGNCLQSGTLYIAESEIRWINSTGFGFTVEYQSVAVHAVSKADVEFPHESLFLSLDVSMPGEGGDSSDAPFSTEVRFVPNDSSSLSPMFQAVAACQRLHPDDNRPEEDAQLDDQNPVDDYNDDDDDDNDDDDEATEVDRHVGLMPESDQALQGEGGVNIECQASVGVANLILGHPLADAGRNSNQWQPVNGLHSMDISQPPDSNPQPEADQFIDAECDL